MQSTGLQFKLRTFMASAAFVAVAAGAITQLARTADGEHFLSLGSQVLPVGYSMLPPLAWLVCVGLVAAFISAVRSKNLWKPSSLWMLLSFLNPIIILCYGVFFDWVRHPTVETDQRCLEIGLLFLSNLAIGLILLVVFRRNLITILGLALAGAWLSMSASLVSIMAITHSVISMKVD